MKSSSFLSGVIVVMVVTSVSLVQSQTLPTSLLEIRPKLLETGSWHSGTAAPRYLARISDFVDSDTTCTQPQQDINYQETLVYEIQSPASLDNFDLISHLVESGSARDRPHRKVAVSRWAIWKIANESTLDHRLLDAAVGIPTPASEDVAIYIPVPFRYQTHRVPQNAMAFSVPEPNTVGLSMLSGWLFLRRRRN